MDRKTLLAFALSGLILLGYTFIVNKYFAPAPQKPAVSATPGPEQSLPEVKKAEPVRTITAPLTNIQQPERTVSVILPLYRIKLSSHGSVAAGWTLTRLPNGREMKNSAGEDLHLLPKREDGFPGSFRLEVPNHPEEISRALNESNWTYEGPEEITLSGGQTKEVSFSLADPVRGLVCTKTFSFAAERYEVSLKVELTQRGQQLPVDVIIGPGFGDQSANGQTGYASSPPQALVDLDGKAKRVNASDLHESPASFSAQRIGWAALTDHYFAIAIRPQEAARSVRLANIKRKEKDLKSGKDMERSFLSAAIPIVNGGANQIFVGPKDRSILVQIHKRWNTGADLEDLIDYGFFSFMVKPLIPLIAWGLGAINRLIGNYGWSIVVFTIIINALLFPLRWKSSVAMKKTQKMQPQMKALQDKMKKLKKDDPEYQRLQTEQLKLMKEGNPLGGCLPLLLQMPFFWAIFIMLTISLEVRQARWVGWIHDLSAADPWHVLPILMCVTMVAQSALTPTPADPQQKMQKTMMTYVMPVMLTIFFFWSAPSGLVLYWMFSNIVGVGQQFLINKLA